MNQAEYLGARMVMLVRRRAAALAEWRAADDAIADLQGQVEAMDATEVYTSTAEIPRVTSEPVRPIAPVDPDRMDGGHTYNLAAVAETLHLPAAVPCPETCRESLAHMHYANGTIVRMQEWGPQTRANGDLGHTS